MAEGREHTRRWQIVVAGLVAIAGAVLGVSLLVVNSDDGDDVKGNVQAGGECNQQGSGNSRGDCVVEADDATPSFAIERGEAPNSYVLRLRGWRPGSIIRTELFGPDGEQIDYPQYAERRVEADGTADTAEGFYFWRYESGEAVGTYRVRVEGESPDGEQVSAEESFEIPWP